MTYVLVSVAALAQGPFGSCVIFHRGVEWCDQIQGQHRCCSKAEILMDCRSLFILDSLEGWPYLTCWLSEIQISIISISQPSSDQLTLLLCCFFFFWGGVVLRTRHHINLRVFERCKQLFFCSPNWASKKTSSWSLGVGVWLVSSFWLGQCESQIYKGLCWISRNCFVLCHY